MATVYLLEGKTDFGAAASFNTAADGSGSNGLPVDGDSLIIAFDNYITANHTALANVDLVRCDITGNITTSGPALSFEVSSGGAGVMTIQCRTGHRAIISANDGIDSLVYEPVSNGVSLSLESGTFPVVKWIGGKLEQQSACIVTTMYRTGGSGVLYDGGTAITTLYNTAGNLECRRSVTTLHNHGTSANMTIAGDAAAATINNSGSINDRSTGIPTTLNNYDGIYNPAGAPALRNLTTVNRFGGVVVTQVGSRTMLTATTFNNFTQRPSTEAVSFIPVVLGESGLLDA